ncbi:MAG: hypothetical protein M3680_26440 [Myxococcota bacterium]|nr:hypothetical protein [Myxococcota bacterium]
MRTSTALARAGAVGLACVLLLACHQDEPPSEVRSVEASLQANDYYGLVNVRLEIPQPFVVRSRSLYEASWVRDVGRDYMRVWTEMRLRDDPALEPCGEVLPPALAGSRHELVDGFIAVCERRESSKHKEVVVVRYITSQAGTVIVAVGAVDPSARQLRMMHAICTTGVVTGYTPHDLVPVAPTEAAMELARPGPATRVQVSLQLPSEYHLDELFGLSKYERTWSALHRPYLTVASHDRNRGACWEHETRKIETLEHRRLPDGELTVCRRERLHSGLPITYVVERRVRTRHGEVGCLVELSPRATREQVQQMTDVCRSVIVTELPPGPADRAQPRAGAADTPTP